MKHVLSMVPGVIALAFAVSGCKGKDSTSIADDPVIDVDNDDVPMNEAIAAARAHLAVFDAELAKAEAGKRFSVKKPFPTPGGGHEHMWLIEVKVVDGGFEGALDNDPRDAKDVRNGGRYVVSRSDLSDWMITDDQSRMWGAYTVRVLLPTMGARDRQSMEKLLQPLPP